MRSLWSTDLSARRNNGLRPFVVQTAMMALTGVMLDVNYWLSAEPLLGPIDLLKGRNGMPPFRWVVVGCESGPRRRPCKIEWVEGIVGQCLAAGVPVFVKQLDIGGKCETDINRFPAHLRIRQVPW